MPLQAIYLSLPDTKTLDPPNEAEKLSKGEGHWLGLLGKEATFKAPYFPAEPIHSIYIGGEAPAGKSIPFLQELLTNLSNIFSIAFMPEISIEALPQNVGIEKLRALKAIGFNRIVLDVRQYKQTNSESLKNSDQALAMAKKIDTVLRAGFTNLSVDLTYNIRLQQPDHWFNTLSNLALAGVPHISAEAIEATQESHPSIKPDIEASNALPAFNGFTAIREFCHDFGYHHYDLVNLALPGYESRQNFAYTYQWNTIGIGPSAEGLLGRDRWLNLEDERAYQEALANDAFPTIFDHLTNKDIANEHLLLGLRSNRGIEPERYIRPCLSASEYKRLTPKLETALKENRLIDPKPDHLLFNKAYWPEVDEWLKIFFS